MSDVHLLFVVHLCSHSLIILVTVIILVGDLGILIVELLNFRHRRFVEICFFLLTEIVQPHVLRLHVIRDDVVISVSEVFSS